MFKKINLERNTLLKKSHRVRFFFSEYSGGEGTLVSQLLFLTPGRMYKPLAVSPYDVLLIWTFS